MTLTNQESVCRIGLYIDGFNLYHAIDDQDDKTLKWLNMKTLGESFMQKNEHLFSCVFFTAVLNWNPEKQRRHRNYIAAQIASGVEIVESNFKRAGRGNYQEKQTDVSIALRMFRDATENNVQRQILVTADSDQIPTVKAIKEMSAETKIILAAPPGRETVSRELGQHVHERRPLTLGRLRTCKLPRNVIDKRGNTIATMPSLYLTD